MTKEKGKASVSSIAEDHFATLKNDDDKYDLADVAVQIAMPVAAGAVVFLFKCVIGDVGALVTGVSIVAALMGAMAVLIFQIRLSIPNDNRLDVYDYELVDEVFSNILWAILVGFTLALGLVVYQTFCVMDLWLAGNVVTSLAVALGLHFVVVVAMCLKRLNLAYMRIAAKRR